MAIELKATVINLKTLSQDIPDPIVVGAGDMAGRKLRIIFTQEAAAQFTSKTKVYLAWYHQEKEIKGYNVFTEIKNTKDKDFPPTWEISYPKNMLYEGNVLACIQIVDKISIATSVNFIIHVLNDPINDQEPEIDDIDYSNFQKIITQVTNLSQDMSDQMTFYQDEFERMQLEFSDIRDNSENAIETVQEALETTQALQNFINNWSSTFENDVQSLINAAKQEVLNEIEIKVEEAEIAHQALWDAINFIIIEDDEEEVGN